MIPIVFDKSRAEQILACLREHKPIELPAAGGWSVNEMLLAAGVCLFGAMTAGPLTWEALGIDLAAVSKERREHAWDHHTREIAAAVCSYANLTRKVWDGSFDEKHGSTFTGRLTVDGDGKVHLLAEDGFGK